MVIKKSKTSEASKKYDDFGGIIPVSVKPDITIMEFDKGNGTFTLHISLQDNKGRDYILEKEIDFNAPGFNSIRKDLRREYSNIHDDLQEANDLKEVNIPDVYASFARLGFFIFDKLKGNQENDIWKKIFEPHPEKPGLVQVYSNHFAIPYEFIIEYGSINEVENSFLATKYLFKKNFRGEGLPFSIYDFPIKVLCLYDSDLEGVEELELPLLKRLNREKKIALKKVAVNEQEEKISNTTQLIDYIKKSDFAILHLACHIDHYGDDLANSYLNFGEVCLKVSDITSLGNALEGKMIFVNGCNSGNSDITNSLSITKELVARKASVVISVDIDIPSRLASQFAAGVYDKMFNSKIERIDDIVYKTAKEICASQKNIGGFFYSLYGHNTILNKNART